MPLTVSNTSNQTISDSRVDHVIGENSKERANHENVWRGIKGWFSSEVKEKAKDTLSSIIHDYDVNKNNKLLNFEQLKYMCSEGYKDKFSANYINDEIKLSIYIEDKDINVFKGKLNDERVLKNLDVAAGHPKDFYIDGEKIYKIISPAEHEGIKSLKIDGDSTPSVEILSLQESKELLLRVRKDNEVVVKMPVIGSEIKKAGNVAYYDFKLGKKTALSNELQRNHRKSSFRASFKEFKHHHFIDSRSSSKTSYYRLEGFKATSKVDLNRTVTTESFKNMFLNTPEKYRDELFKDLKTDLNKRLIFTHEQEVTFVGGSILFAIPENPIGDYGFEVKYEKPEVKFIDFAHPIKSDEKGYEAQKRSIIKGVQNLLNDLRVVRDQLRG